VLAALACLGTLAGVSALGCRTQREAAVPTDLDARAAALEAVLESSSEPLPPGTLRIRLAFGPGADLDLYVTDTDPSINETVYFARHATRGGGRLLRDARCSDAAPRSDAAIFDPPLAAGYRIGIDYHASCGSDAKPEVFVVEVAAGELREVRRGVARPGHFADRFWLYAPQGVESGDQYIPNVK